MADPSRLPRVPPSDLDETQRSLYDTFVNGPRQSQASFFAVADAEGILSGPYRAMLLSPALGAPLERLGRAVRYESALPDRVRELVILTVAALTESDVEWHAHEGMALAAGLGAATVYSLRTASPVFEGEGDAVVHAFVTELVKQHAVDDDTFDNVQTRFGRDGLFELVVTAGYYELIGHINNAFALRVPDPAPSGASS